MRSGVRAVLAAAVVMACRDPVVPERPGAESNDIATPTLGFDAINLGTLGGDTTIPFALNDSADVVGWSLSTGGARRAFLWRQGVLSDLGGFEGGNTAAHAVDNRGRVAGIASTDGIEHAAVLWEGGGIHTLAAPYSMQALSRIVALGENGDVLAKLDYFGYCFRGGLWRDGAFTDLGVLQAPDAWCETVPVAMSRGGAVAGMSVVCEVTGFWYYRPFRWADGINDLGGFGADACPEPEQGLNGFSPGAAYDINDWGQAVGMSYDSSGVPRAFRWSDGALTDLGVAPGQPATAVSINNHGRIAGDAGEEGFVWDNGVVTAIGSLGGGGTWVVDLNEAGDIVGSSLTESGERHGFVWRQGVMTDLGSSAEACAARYNPVRGCTNIAINAPGDVLFGGRSASGAPRAVLFRRVRPVSTLVAAAREPGGDQ